jgi:hypothetical protein
MRKRIRKDSNINDFTKSSIFTQPSCSGDVFLSWEIKRLSFATSSCFQIQVIPLRFWFMTKPKLAIDKKLTNKMHFCVNVKASFGSLEENEME